MLQVWAVGHFSLPFNVVHSVAPFYPTELNLTTTGAHKQPKQELFLHEQRSDCRVTSDNALGAT